MPHAVLGTLLIVGTLGGAFAAAHFSAKRFSERKQREGLWGPDGPIEPTEPPAGWMRRRDHFSAVQREYDDQRFAEDERARLERRGAAHSHGTVKATVALRLKRNGRLAGRITHADFLVLCEELESDSTNGTVFFIDSPTIDALRRAGAPDELLTMLTDAVGGGDGEEVECVEAK